MKKPLLATFLFVLLAGVRAAPADAEITVVLGLYPEEKPSNTIEAMRPALNAVEEHMTARLGEEVRIQIQMSSDYVTALNALLAGDVDFARLGAASYVMGKTAEPGLQLLVMENSHGSVSFEGMIVVRDDSNLFSLSDLKGGSFAFVSERSTLGRFFAQAYLAQAGIHAADLRDYDYIGDHEAVGLAVSSGRYDAGAMNRRIYDKLVSRGLPLRPIARFENVTRAWAGRAGLPAETAESLRQALLSLRDPELLETLGFDGFLPGAETHFEATRQVIANHAQAYSQYKPKSQGSIQ